MANKEMGVIGAIIVFGMICGLFILIGSMLVENTDAKTSEGAKMTNSVGNLFIFVGTGGLVLLVLIGILNVVAFFYREFS